MGSSYIDYMRIDFKCTLASTKYENVLLVGKPTTSTLRSMFRVFKKLTFSFI